MVHLYGNFMRHGNARPGLVIKTVSLGREGEGERERNKKDLFESPSDEEKAKPKPNTTN